MHTEEENIVRTFMVLAAVINGRDEDEIEEMLEQMEEEMARRKRIVVTCPNCRREMDYWVAESAQELPDVLFCRYCGENFNKKGNIVHRDDIASTRSVVFGGVKRIAK